MREMYEITEMIDRCDDSDLRGMSYEDGVKIALEWVTLMSDDEPIEKD